MGPIPHTEFRQHRTDVRFDGFGTDEQVCRYLRVRQAPGHQPQNRRLSVGERGPIETIPGGRRRRVATFSLGMRQRLGIAAALLGDPRVLILDEPSNGLDPEGIIWIREALQRFAREGRTVLVSSHLMGETAAFADHLLVLGEGRLRADTPVDECVRTYSEPGVRLRTRPGIDLGEVLAASGFAA